MVHQYTRHTVLIDLDPTDERPLYQQIVDEIRRALVLGDLKADDPLPSVRALATRLHVNPNTVQQAFRELERAGLAYSRRGQGTFVSRGAGEGERDALLQQVSERALADARRFGFEPGELLDAIARASGSLSSPSTSGKP